MNSVEKKKYRRSKKWQTFRQEILKKRQYRCELCGQNKTKKNSHGLHLHHYNEENYGNETEQDIKIVCRACHKWLELQYRKIKANKYKSKYTNIIKNILKDFFINI